MKSQSLILDQQPPIYVTSSLVVLVDGLGGSITNQDLFEYFLQFGSILSCKAQVWNDNPLKCRGLALVEAGNTATYNRILASPHRLKGRTIQCDPISEKKEEESPHHAQGEEDRKLFIIGLCKSVDERVLGDFFCKFGPVAHAHIVRHGKDKKSKGFGFVTFYSIKDKNKALSAEDLKLNSKQIFCRNYLSKDGTKNHSDFVAATFYPPEQSKCQPSMTKASHYNNSSYASPADCLPKTRPYLAIADSPERMSQYHFRRMGGFLRWPTWPQQQ